jgi:hypothetical protein
MWRRVTWWCSSASDKRPHSSRYLDFHLYQWTICTMCIHVTNVHSHLYHPYHMYIQVSTYIFKFRIYIRCIRCIMCPCLFIPISCHHQYHTYHVLHARAAQTS